MEATLLNPQSIGHNLHEAPGYLAIVEQLDYAFSACFAHALTQIAVPHEGQKVFSDVGHAGPELRRPWAWKHDAMAVVDPMAFPEPVSYTHLDVYKRQVLEQLNREAPDGIDVYFDNVGGESLEAALSALRLHGRIVACGAISIYNAEAPHPGPSNLANIIGKRLTMKGFIVSDWFGRRAEFEEEVGAYVKAGKVKNKETVMKGIDQAPAAFIGLFHGQNVGKMVVELA